MLKIGILFGGASYEHEISIVSAFQLKRKIETKYEVHMIYISLTQEVYLADKMKISDFKEHCNKKLKKTHFTFGGISKLKLDAIVGMMHGENGEDGLACALCRFYQIKYLGCNLFSSSTAIHKYYSYLLLQKNDVPMVETVLYTYENYLEGKTIPFLPCIIKPACGGSSIGITICHQEDEVNRKLYEAFSYTQELVIQPYFSSIKEFNLALNEDTYSNLECIHKKDEIFSFENKYTDSFKQMHQSLIEDERYEDFCSLARRVYSLLDCSGIIRIDFFLVEDRIYVNEVNTTPGALAMYLFPDFISIFDQSLNRCINQAIKEYPKGTFLAKNRIEK